MSAGQVSGRAIVYNTQSVNLGGFREVIHPDALRNVDLRDVLLIRDHESARVLARTTAGSLRLTNTRHGLDFTASLADTSDGRDAYNLLAGGEVHQCSFSFYMKKDSWYETEDGTPLRVVEEIRAVPELTLTGFPAYPASYAGAGEAAGRSKPPSQFQAMVRAHAMSKPADMYSARAMNRPGVKPIPPPAWVPAKFARRDVKQIRSLDFGGLS